MDQIILSIVHNLQSEFYLRWQSTFLYFGCICRTVTLTLTVLAIKPACLVFAIKLRVTCCYDDTMKRLSRHVLRKTDVGQKKKIRWANLKRSSSEFRIRRRVAKLQLSTPSTANNGDSARSPSQFNTIHISLNRISLFQWHSNPVYCVTSSVWSRQSNSRSTSSRTRSIYRPPEGKHRSKWRIRF